MRRWKGLPAIALLVAVGCGKDVPEIAPEERAPASDSRGAGKVEIVAAPESVDVTALVRAELARAKADGKVLLVYVGAKWCEPCTRFHDAAKAGKLDRGFPALRLLEFDLDRDADALARGGYSSKMIPLFAVPLANGRGSGEQIQGGIKGDGAVRHITNRLAPLVARARAEEAKR